MTTGCGNYILHKTDCQVTVGIVQKKAKQEYRWFHLVLHVIVHSEIYLSHFTSYLSLSVLNAISIRMSATIQKRMTIFDSFQPSSSKW